MLLSMLTLYRRHVRACPNFRKAEPRKWRNCQCPVWTQGTLRGERIKRSLEVRSWEAGQKIVRAMESGETSVVMTMKQAGERWLADSAARNLKPPTLAKYRLVIRELVERFGELTVDGISVDDLRQMREAWKLAPATEHKRLELIRAFFTFCVASGWVRVNPATSIKPPAREALPTLPYSEEEWTRILWAIDTYREVHPRTPENVIVQLRALVLLMRYSGLRISDAVSLRREKIDSEGRLFLYQAKTREPVLVPLPPIVLNALAKVDEGDVCYFWNGHSVLKTALTHWQDRLKKLFVIAGIPEGHGHRLRDTFACGLLQKGVPLETVSILLGHRSIKITERYYAPWISARQEHLDLAVRKTWATEVQHDQNESRR